MCSSLSLGVERCHLWPILEPFHHPEKEILHPLATPHGPPSPSAPGKHQCSICLGILYKQNHTVCAPLWLAFLIWCHVFEVHPCDSAYQFCFCWLSNNKQYVTKPCIYHQLMELWVGSTLGLLIMLLWTLIYMFLCGHVFISLWWDFILKFHRLI